MTQSRDENPQPPASILRRRSLDWLWIAVLIGSVITGIGMTIFAPV